MRWVPVMAVAACWRDPVAPDPVDPATTVQPAPRAPSCSQVAAHVAVTVDGDRAALHDAIATRCSTDQWSAALRQCAVTLPKGDNGERCRRHATPAQQDALQLELDAIERDVPRECIAYRRAVDRLAACDQLPPGLLDVLTQSMELAWPGWQHLPADARANAASECGFRRDAVLQSLTGMCGP
jgi:hypothetical protein